VTRFLYSHRAFVEFSAAAASVILCPVATTLPEPRTQRGAGGTPGGLGQFFVGLVMTVAGGYLILNQVTVTTSFWRFGQYGGFGLSLLPLLAGIGFLFYNGRSVLGWILTVSGAAIILASVLMHMDIYFRPTSLFNTLMMLGLLFGGLGLIARSLRASE
jgi:uncharacterized protein